jgi:Domain of unknown function (DUF4440)
LAEVNTDEWDAMINVNLRGNQSPQPNGVEPWPTANNTAPSCSSSTGNFVRSVEEADVAWFDANLAADFLNTNPDGSLIDREAFLAQIGRGSIVKNIREHGVMIRILGDFAIIHARTTDMNPDGTRGAGRYTDDWQFRDGRWQCVSAHFTRA